MIAKLPGWVVDDATSVRREVAEWIGTTEAERWRLAVLCSRDTMWAIRAGDDPQRVLDWVDPLPAGSIAALARLRSTKASTEKSVTEPPRDPSSSADHGDR